MLEDVYLRFVSFVARWKWKLKKFHQVFRSSLFLARFHLQPISNEPKKHLTIPLCSIFTHFLFNFPRFSSWIEWRNSKGSDSWLIIKFKIENRFHRLPRSSQLGKFSAENEKISFNKQNVLQKAFRKKSKLKSVSLSWLKIFPEREKNPKWQSAKQNRKEGKKLLKRSLLFLWESCRGFSHVFPQLRFVAAWTLLRWLFASFYRFACAAFVEKAWRDSINLNMSLKFLSTVSTP